MVNYKEFEITQLDNNKVEQIYSELLKNKWQFVILSNRNKQFVLTKEKSLFEILDRQEFINTASNDKYYKTVITGMNIQGIDADMELYRQYINKYRSSLQKTVYGGKYLFGSVAVKTTGGFITTIRGKEDLNDCTIVHSVDHNNRVVFVTRNKATLNAALLDYLFTINPSVKAIVHLNAVFDDSLPYLEYAFPGTVRDSQRDIRTSFNIRQHGLFYLFDKKGNLI